MYWRSPFAYRNSSNLPDKFENSHLKLIFLDERLCSKYLLLDLAIAFLTLSKYSKLFDETLFSLVNLEYDCCIWKLSRIMHRKCFILISSELAGFQRWMSHFKMLPWRKRANGLNWQNNSEQDKSESAVQIAFDFFTWCRNSKPFQFCLWAIQNPFPFSSFTALKTGISSLLPSPRYFKMAKFEKSCLTLSQFYFNSNSLHVD